MYGTVTLTYLVVILELYSRIMLLINNGFLNCYIDLCFSRECLPIITSPVNIFKWFHLVFLY